MSRPELVTKLEATIGEYEMAVLPRPLKLLFRLMRVLIIDAMAALQGMKMTPGMNKICHLKESFITRIHRMLNGYDECHSPAISMIA